jgi:uncharacterized membrane protein
MASESTQENTSCETNISNVERWISLAAGGALAAYGLTRRSPGGVALALGGAALLYRGVMKHCPMYGAMGIDTSGEDCDAPAQEFAPSTPVKHGFVVQQAVTIDRPREEVYSYWRNFENLPQFMNHLVEVRVLDEKRSTWVARAPGRPSRSATTYVVSRAFSKRGRFRSPLLTAESETMILSVLARVADDYSHLMMCNDFLSICNPEEGA